MFSRRATEALRNFCRLAILPHLLRLMSLIRSELTGENGGTPLSEDAATVVFGDDDHGTKYGIRRRCRSTSDEERPPILSGEPECRLLRINATRFSERGPPGQNDENLTNAEWGMNRINARAA